MCVLIRVVSRYHFTFTTEYIHIVLKTFLPLVTGCCRFDQITRGKITKNWKIHHSLFDGGHFDFNTTSSPGSSPFPVAAISKSERTLGVRLRSADVALQLCPPLQFGPLTYQPIECVFVSSNQSALWSCLLHVTSQLGEGCSMSFVRFSVLIVWKTCVWNSLEHFPWWVFGEFYRSLKFVRNFPRSTHMFICWRARKRGTRMKAQSKSSKKDSSNKNVRRLWGGTSQPPYFRASEVRCYLQFFQRLFYIRDMVQISSS